MTDGSKRLGWSACVRALELNGYALQVDEEEAHQFVLEVVIDNLRVADIAERLSEWLIEL